MAQVEAGGLEGSPGSRQPQFVRRTTPSLMRHPDYPHLPDTVPMTYTLAMKACLSHHPKDRPSFPQILTILHDLKAETETGTYINSGGCLAVRMLPQSGSRTSALL